MKRHFFISFAALAAMVSCEQENGLVPGTEPTEGRREVTIVANASETKTTLSDEAVLWENGDAVRLLFTPETGTDFSIHTEEFTTATPGATATFTGSIPNDVKYGGNSNGYSDALYMVYPSTAMDEKTGKVTFGLSATQEVAPGSFPSGSNLSSALTSFEYLESTGTAEATFLNAFAIIRFVLPENVAKLEITGTANLAGEAEFKFVDQTQPWSGRLVADSFTSESKSVTLTPSSGTSFTADQTYNVLVYPGTHSEITVKLTDTDGCTYSKTVTSSFEFVAAQYYTFRFNTDFGKNYSFTVSGVPISDDGIVKAVFTGSDETHAVDAVVTESKFSVRLPHDVEPDTGYAVYPGTAYLNGKVNYNLSATGTPEALYSAALDLDAEAATFYSVESALSKMNFTVPAGVSKVTVYSTVGFAGNTEMTVGTDGRMTAGTGDQKTVTLDLATSGEVTLNVYPFTGATITVTLTDAASAVNTQTFTAQQVTAGATLTLSLDQDIDFEKGGSFSNENFTSGGGTIKF